MEQGQASASGATSASTGTGRPVVYLHIGAPKTGTTYLQDILWRNRGSLRRDGVLYPVPPGYAAHFLAAQDLQGIRFQGFPDPAVPGAWDRLVKRARGWNDRVVVSHELLSVARPEHIERAMESFAFADIHVIFTARDLVRQIPAAWQEDLKNRGTIGFNDFVRALRDPEHSRRSPGTRSFWRMQDATDVLGRWGRYVPPERMHVVTVPQPGASQNRLWERFAGLVGLDPLRYDTTVDGSNQSLGAAEARLLRRVNVALRGQVEWPEYDRLVKKYLAPEVLARRPDPVKIVLPPREYAWVEKRSQEIVDGLRAAGYHVVGDLDELLPARPRPAEPRAAQPRPDEDGEGPRLPKDMTDADLLDAAVDAITDLVVRAGRQQPRPRASGPRGAVPRASAAVRAVWGLRERHPSVMRLRDLYWRSRARTTRRDP